MLIPGTIEISYYGNIDPKYAETNKIVDNYKGPITLKMGDDSLFMDFEFDFPSINRGSKISFDLIFKPNVESTFSSVEDYIVISTDIIYHKKDTIMVGLIGCIINEAEDFNFIVVFPDFNLKQYESKYKQTIWSL